MILEQNTTGVALESAARTATITTPVIQNKGARGVIIYLSVTAASGTGGLAVQALGVDPVNPLNVIALNTAPTGVTATTSTTPKAYMIYPAASLSQTGVTQHTAGALPRHWAIKVTAADSSSYTYTVSYSYLS